ncbi:MAG TPA: TlpA disulfide reductase family protein [Acidimicrobiia bacterium]|nr:TlpA disulfide reductase family protein [Acidimicrobiia bacterium]
MIALGVGVAVAALAVVLALQVGDDQLQAQPRSELLGDAAPDFVVTTLDGEEITLESLAGKAVIVNFWNSWCIPCKQEEPALKEFYEQHRDETDFALVGIVRDDTEAAARSAVDDRGIEWPMGVDRGGRAALDFGTRGQPETYAITPDGRVAGTQYGPATVDHLETLLAAARGQR